MVISNLVWAEKEKQGIRFLKSLCQPVWLITAACVLVLAFLDYYLGPNGWGRALLWGPFLLLASLAHFPRLRLRWVSQPLFSWYRTRLPPLSSTEQEALQAGTVWWDADLFSGRPQWSRLLATPAPTLSAEEEAFLNGPTEELCHNLDDWRITRQWHDLPPEAWDFIKLHGFFGMIIPREYGGLGFSALAHSSVVMKLASRSVSAAVTVMVPNSLGPAELLLHYGTQAQKDYYLPRLARGQEIPCFALTGPEAGSDAGAIPDRGVVCHGMLEGKSIMGIRLNWDKRYITLSPVATLLGLAFKLYDPDHLLGEQESLGITLALIPVKTPGVSIGNRHNPLDLAFQNGPTQGKDVFVPLDWVIGGVDRVGQGWRMLMESLAVGRSISLPAMSAGSGKLVSNLTGAYAMIRRQFNMPVGRFEGVQEALARIAGNTYLMEAARRLTVGAVDRAEKPSVLSAIVKYHLTERMRSVVNDAMDVHGGRGICMGPRNYLARAYQAIPISITVEGANILTRSMIIFGQGALRCHPYLLAEMESAMDDDKKRGLRRFDQAMFGHARHIVSNFLRTCALAWSGARWVSVPVGGPVARYYRQLSRMSVAFALVADVALVLLGGALKRKERISGRLGDILSLLYLASAVLKRFEDQGRPEEDFPLVAWGCEDCLLGIQEAMTAILRNFPMPWLGRILSWLIFPLGKPYAGPSDALEKKVAEILLQPTATRERLVEGIYRGSGDPDDPLGQMEFAFAQVVAIEPLLRRIKEYKQAGQLAASGQCALLQEAVAKGLLSQAEQAQIEAAEEARKRAIQVDEFSPEQFATGEV